MVDFISEFFKVVSMYVSLLFNLFIVPGVSVGALLLFVTIIGLVVKVFWPRGG